MTGSAYYTLTNGNIEVSTESQALPSNYIFVIPQSCAANDTDGVYLEVKYTVTDNTQKTANIPFAVNWAAGNKYTINISLGTKYIEL